MWHFLKSGGVFMIPLVLTSIVGLAFIIERGLALRWDKVIPPEIGDAAENCAPDGLGELRQLCVDRPSTFSRLLLVAADHLPRPRDENVDAIQTHARHEILQLERGLVVLEIIVGIAPLLGLVGAISGLITLFSGLGETAIIDNARIAKGIAEVLNTTLAGLLIAIPSLIAWSYYNKKIETLAVEMETLCDKFLRRQYRDRKQRI
ncbi:MAG: MotA/TolQ/ExbB proton channel family protein [Verrucomicrobia bacterium]|nr:MotA/TolQ/ExbB proton channel family protein [Verrucomicrobiota bacterium]